MSESSPPNVSVLQKSQLRKLAREFFVGRIDEAEYRRRRRTLIDGIADGDIHIERDDPLSPAPASAPEEETTLRMEQPVAPGRRLSPLHIGVGVLVLALAGWVLLVLGRAGPPAHPTSVAAPPSTAGDLPARTISETRGLVEQFLAERDWTEPAVQTFVGRWDEMSGERREEARAAAWFRRLTKAIRDELKTQRALANFDKSGAAEATAARLSVFRQHLLGAETAPDTRPRGADEAPAAAGAMPPAPTAAGATRSAPPAAGAAPPAPPAVAAAPEPVAGAAPGPGEPTTEPTVHATISPAIGPVPAPAASAAPAARPRPPSGREWLDRQPDDGFTLQLYALNHLDRIERVIARHGDLDLRVVAYEGESPRYRVLYGNFTSESNARDAYARLPDEVRASLAAPLVKSIAEVKRPPAARPPGWLDALPRDGFTLQLFASDIESSAKTLLRAHPSVPLGLVRTTSGRSLFRVLYGSFETAVAADRAIAGLPAAVVRDTGRPVVKSVAELMDAR